MNDANNPYEFKAHSPELPLSPPGTFSPRALLGSLLVMILWPVIGIAICLAMSLFEETGEAVYFFGSVTMILLLPLAMVVNSMWIFGALSGIVWLLVLLIPFCVRKKSVPPRFHFQTVLVLQSLFSASQAGIGFLVVLGKYC